MADFDSSYNTVLSPEEEKRFAQWKARYAPSDSGDDYDLRGAFKAGLKPDAKSGHWPDTFKKPNHPTFSNESRYARFGKPGHWEGEKFVAADAQTPVRWSDAALEDAGGRTVWMSPDDYLKLAPDLVGKPFESKQGKELKGSLDAGDEVYAVPSLTVKKGRVTAQDGRHRALAAKEAGVRLIPVKLDGDEAAAGQELVGMRGTKVKVPAPARAWEEVVKDPEFRKLPATERETARRQYFDQVVAPRLSAADVEAARGQFETDTRPRRAPRDMAAAEPMSVDPTDGMSDWQKRAAGYGSALPNLARGTGGLVRDTLELAGGKKVADVAGLPTHEDIEDARRRDAPLAAAGTVEKPPVLYTGKADIQGGRLGVHRGWREQGSIPGPGAQGMAAGNFALALPLAVAPGANTVLGAGAYGVGYGAVQPATSWEERGSNALVAGGTSGAVTLGARAGPALWRAFGAPLTAGGRDRIALDTINRFARDPNAVRNAMSRPAPTGAPAIDELVPGSRASLAEVTEDPGIAQAQRAAQAASPDAANAIATSKTARLEARRNALLKQFGIGDRQTLEATRDSIAERLYRDAWETPIDPKVAKNLRPEVKSLLGRPSIQKARSEALEIAREEGEILRPADIQGVGSVKGLHYMKKAMDREIERTKTADPMWSAKVVGTQKKFLEVMDELSPAYKRARAEYAKASKPVNQERIGSYLYEKLFPALSDVGAERLTPQAFAKVLREGNAMAKKATGFSGAKLKDILTTDQWNTVVNLAKDVGRETGAMERGRVPGSPTAQYLSGRNVLRQTLGPLGLPEGWSEKMGSDLFANKWTSMLASPVERDVQNRLATMLTDPRAAAKAQSALDASRAGMLPRTANALTRYVLPPTAVTTGVLSTRGE